MGNIKESVEVTRLFQEVMNLFKLKMKKELGETGISVPKEMVIECEFEDIHKNHSKIIEKKLRIYSIKEVNTILIKFMKD